MCRLLAFVADHPVTFPDLLGDAWPSFVELSRWHKDGWGMAWLQDGIMQATKEPVAAFRSALFEKSVARPTRAAILHLRWATPGMPVELNNTHPFVDSQQNVAFVHNGSVGPRAYLKRLIDPRYAQNVAGTTDSEQYFWAWASAEETDPGHGFSHLWPQIAASPAYTGLNAMVLSPSGLEVIAAHHPQAPFTRDDPQYYQLRCKQTSDFTVIASTHWNVPSDWDALPEPSITRVWLDPGIRVDQVPL